MRLKKKSHQAKLEVGKKSQGEYQVKEIYNIDRYISMIELHCVGLAEQDP